MKKRYITVWRNKFLTSGAKSVGGMAKALREAADEMDEMAADGVRLLRDGGTEDDYARLVTFDPAVAKKYGMEEELDGVARRR